MFLSREEKEAARQKKQKIEELEESRGDLMAQYDEQFDRYEVRQEVYVRNQLPHWEYVEISSKNENYWKRIESLGKAGWEMVGIATFAEGGQFKEIHTSYVFKRPLLPADPNLTDQVAEINRLLDQIHKLDRQITAMKNS